MIYLVVRHVGIHEMRVIAGKARGVKLRVPPKVTRPTTDRVKESLFGILHEVVVGAKVADLFAGSGGLGLEALSRGAVSCDFIENDRNAVGVIEDNLRKTKLKGGKVLSRDVFSFLKHVGGYDVVFADPPYYKNGKNAGRNFSKELLEWVDWNRILNEHGFLILEQEEDEELYDAEGILLMRARRYGCTRIVIYRKVS